MNTRWTAVALAAALPLSGCGDPKEVAVPDATAVESYYTIPVRAEFGMNGNVAEVEVWQSADHLRRGGALWAKMGPYFYLFTDATRDLFEDYDGLAAVRVITRAPGGIEVARATLHRDRLNDLTWKRALNVAGNARLHGGDKLGLLQNLVSFGEDHTEYRYNADYT